MICTYMPEADVNAPIKRWPKSLALSKNIRSALKWNAERSPPKTLMVVSNRFTSLKFKNASNYFQCTIFRNQVALGDSHIAGKKYWIISRVVEVITSQSNEIYHEWPKATSDKFHYSDKWLPQPQVILSNTFHQLCGNNIPKIVDIEP